MSTLYQLIYPDMTDTPIFLISNIWQYKNTVDMMMVRRKGRRMSGREECIVSLPVTHQGAHRN
jgi:hypothetical protein